MKHKTAPDLVSREYIFHKKKEKCIMAKQKFVFKMKTFFIMAQALSLRSLNEAKSKSFQEGFSYVQIQT